MASASWSSATEQTKTRTGKLIDDQKVNQVEERAHDPPGILTVKRVEDITNIRPYGRYCAPFVDECDDESEEICGGSLPRDFPYVLDDANLSPTPISKGSRSSPQPSLYQEENISNVSLNIVEEKATLSNINTILGPPHPNESDGNINGSYTIVGLGKKSKLQVADPKDRSIRAALQSLSGASMSVKVSDDEDYINSESASSSAAEEQLGLESDTDSSFGGDAYDEDNSGHESILLDDEVQSYRDALSRNINCSATFAEIMEILRQ